MNITIRMSLLYMFLISIPALLGLYWSLPRLFNYKYKYPESPHVTQNFYMDKSALETSQKFPDYQKIIERQNKLIDAAQNEAVSQVKYSNMFVFLLSLGIILFNLLEYATTKITFNNDEVKVDSLFLLPILPQTSFKVTDIDKVWVQTTTPFIPDRKRVEQINWREKIHFLSGNTILLTLFIFVFPKGKKLLLELLKQKPNIEIVFTKNTVRENLLDNVFKFFKM